MSKAPKPSRDYAAIAEQYVRDVLSGAVVAGKWLTLAARRHQDDVRRSADPEWPYTFDGELANRVGRFMEKFGHIKGKWARKKERITLEPWQCFAVASLFGWVDKTTRKRRFRESLMLVARKNGKSVFAALIGLWMLGPENEPSAEVYSGAAKNEKQAWEVFGQAREMAMAAPDYRAKYGIDVLARNLSSPRTASKFVPIIGKPGDGASPSCAIHDEYHEHKTDEQVDAMRTGMGAREQPLQFIITTAGDNLSGPCFAAKNRLERTLEGVVPDDRFWGVIYAADPADDWLADATLMKANPNLGVSIELADLRIERDQAKNDARKMGVFKTKKLNIWVQSRAAFFNTQRWIECARKHIALDQFRGDPCTIGFDLASKIDIAAVEILFDLRDCMTDVAASLRDEGFIYATFGRHYLPEATVDLPENEHYRGWRDDKHLIVTDGQMIDLGRIEHELLELCGQFQVNKIGYDPHQATQMATNLMANGAQIVEFRPLVQLFSEPMKNIDGLVRGRQIAHNGDPVMTWMMSNVVAKVDGKDNVYPRKERPQNKIDGPVALIQAMGVHMTTPRSAYEERGLRTL